MDEYIIYCDFCEKEILENPFFSPETMRIYHNESCANIDPNESRSLSPLTQITRREASSINNAAKIDV